MVEACSAKLPDFENELSLRIMSITHFIGVFYKTVMLQNRSLALRDSIEHKICRSNEGRLIRCSRDCVL